MVNEHSGHIANGIKSLYDPIEKAEETAQIVCRGNQRRYYRFRPARFYGGIGTADCLGCCLRCLFCWSWDKVMRPGRYGKFYPPYQVAGKLTSTAYKKGFRQVRISGNEPTLSRDHLLQAMVSSHNFAGTGTNHKIWRMCCVFWEQEGTILKAVSGS